MQYKMFVYMLRNFTELTNSLDVLIYCTFIYSWILQLLRRAGTLKFCFSTSAHRHCLKTG